MRTETLARVALFFAFVALFSTLVQAAAFVFGGVR